MSITAKPPYKYFTELDGTALKSGKMYVGVAGLDAEANPVAAYWDTALTIAAAQPIRTIGGVPDNAGTPSDFFTAGDYSITVRDKNDVLVYSKLQLNANDPDNLDLYKTYDDYAAFKASTEGSRGIGAIWRYGPYSGIEVASGGDVTNSAGTPVHLNVLASAVGFNVLAFGPTGDGIVDDTAAVNNAFTRAADEKVPLVSFGGTYRCTSSIILKSNLTFHGGGSTKFVQDYEYVVGPKQESLFVNESYNDNGNLDTDIHISDFIMENDADILTGSFISINRCENYSIQNVKATKTSANGTMNINGKNVYLNNITIDSLAPSGLNSDGIHFEYLEDVVISNLNIQSQDDCLGFAYFPIITEPNNGPAGRDKTSRNIVVSNCVLQSDIANGIRLGNTTLLGVATDDQIHVDARYENVTFNNIIFNKVGVTGACIEMHDIRTNTAQPNNEIRFNNMVVHDFTSADQMIRIYGNAYTSGDKLYGDPGIATQRNYNRIFFNGISGKSNTAGQTINANGVQRLTLEGFNIERGVAADNEMITQLVDDLHISNSFIKSVALSGTSNTIFVRDFENVVISGGQIAGSGLEVAALRLDQPNVGNGGRVVLMDTILNGQVGGVHSVSALILDELQIHANTTGLTGTIRNSNLTATVNDIAPMHTLNANCTMPENECRRSYNTAVVNLKMTVTATISAGVNIASFPNGIKPQNANAIRCFFIDTAGAVFSADYSLGAGLRSQSSIVAGTYFLSLAYQVD
jgi:polygalacturonase